MNINIGSNIKIICQNGMIEAGKLIEHTSKQLVLELIDKSTIIIQKPDDNIVAIKISGIEMASRTPSKVHVDLELNPETYHRREDLRALDLAELHKLRAQEERKRAIELLRSRKLSSIPEVIFGTPNFSKSVYKYPKKKTR